MKRFHQLLLLATFLPLCWLSTMAVHELGHVLAAYGTNATVTKVVLLPFEISRTDVDPNPRPLVVAWSGPIVGVLLPLVIWLAFIAAKIPGSDLPRFFCGFCLVANGAYIGIGALDGVGDAGDMIRHGSPRWVLWLFGAVTVPVGFSLWHRLGSRFGFGDSSGQVDPKAAYISLIAFAFTFATAILLR